MVSFYGLGFNRLKAAEPLRRDNLVLITKFAGAPGTHLIDLGTMKG